MRLCLVGLAGAVLVCVLLGGCLGSVTDLRLVNGVATVSEDTLDLGMADCGGVPAESRALTLRNDGAGNLQWSAAFESNAWFGLVGLRSGVLEPGAQATLTVVAASIPADVVAGTALSATLLVTTSDPARKQLGIPVSATARGATFEVRAPAAVDFGQVPIGSAAPDIAILLQNTGNAAARVTIGPPADPQFGFSWAQTGGEVMPGATLVGLRAHFEPTSISAAASFGPVSVTGAVCGDSAKRLDVKGQGLSGIGISPATVDFGHVPCGTQALPQSFTLYNTGAAPYAWTAKLADGRGFVLSQSEGAVDAGGATTVTVTPAPTGMTTNLADNAYGDTVTITSNVAGDTPHVVPIRLTAYGAILKWSSTVPLAFGVQPLFMAGAEQSRFLENEGNAPAEVTLTAGAFQATPSSANLAPGDTLEAKVAYTPDNFGPQTGNLEVDTDSPLCQPPPGGVPASGQGGMGAASAISVGGRHHRGGTLGDGGCAVLASSGGRVACWGSSLFGQLGVVTTATAPNVIPGLSGVVQTTSGDDFHCALDAQGDVYCWGNNRSGSGATITGKLGVVDVAFTEVPRRVVGVAGAVQVSAGHNMACAVINDGTVRCWGGNRRGNLGNGGSSIPSLPPTQLPNLSNITSVAVGGGGGCARRNDGTVWCWGRYLRGAGGNGTVDATAQLPLQVSNLTDATAVMTTTASARCGSRCALRAGMGVVCWGNQRHGSIGNGANTTTAATTPVALSGISGAVGLAGYLNGGCARLAGGTVRCWGRNRHGQVGDGTTNARTTPVQVSGLTGATALAAGGRSACAIVEGGSIKCWGEYGAGGSLVPQTLPSF